MSFARNIRSDRSKPELVSSRSRPVVMRIRCSTSISRRGSSAPRHSGIGAGIEGVTRPCCVRMPISALTMDLVMEKPGQRRVDADAGRVAFGNHLAVVDHDHRLGPPERRCRGLFEGVIERRLQRRIGWFDQCRTGNLGKQRRRLRLQRLDVVLQEIRLFRSEELDASEPVVERRTAAEQSERRSIDGPGGAVDLELERVTQTPDPGAVGEFA